MSKRPIPVMAIACLYVLTGALGAAFHGMEFFHDFQKDMIWAVLTSLLAVVAGVCMLMAQNWARWLAIGWIAFHVVLSAFHSMPEMAVHGLLCAVIAYLLLRPEANQYFLRSMRA